MFRSPIIQAAGVYAGIKVLSPTGSDSTDLITNAFANDGHYYLKDGDYYIDELSFTGKTLVIEMSSGARFLPNAGVSLMMLFTNSYVTFITNGEAFNGQGIAQIGIKTVGGRFTQFGIIKPTNFGRAGSTATDWVTPLWLDTGTNDVFIDHLEPSDLRSVGEGTVANGNNIGSVRGVMFIGTGFARINYFKFDANGGYGEEYDLFHANSNTAGGSIGTLVLRYNGQTRRCVKIQSGIWHADNVDIRKSADFVAVDPTVLTDPFTTTNGSADVAVLWTGHGFSAAGEVISFAGAAAAGGITISGEYVIKTRTDANNLVITHSAAATSSVTGGGSVTATKTGIGARCVSCIDFAGSGNGSFTATSGYVDTSGFAAGIGSSGGSGGTGSVRIRNLEVIGSKMRVDRPVNPDSGSSQVIDHYAFFSSALGDRDTSAINCIFRNCHVPAWLRGERSIFNNNYLDDPVKYAADIGQASTNRVGMQFNDNVIETKTSGYLNQSRVILLRQGTDMQVNRNKLRQNGNTTHTVNMINATVAGATFSADGNEFPATATAGTVIPIANTTGTGAIVRERGTNLKNWTVLNFNTASTANSSTSETDLRTFTIPRNMIGAANQRIRVKARGRTANNANAKTVKAYLGSATILTTSLTISAASNFEVNLEIIATAASAQNYFSRIITNDAVVVNDQERGTATEASNATISLRITGQGGASSDIIIDDWTVEYLT